MNFFNNYLDMEYFYFICNINYFPNHVFLYLFTVFYIDLFYFDINDVNYCCLFIKQMVFFCCKIMYYKFHFAASFTILYHNIFSINLKKLHKNHFYKFNFFVLLLYLKIFKDLIL